MPKFLVDLWLDGYETENEEVHACEEFILEQLEAASCVKVTRLPDDFEASDESK